MSNIGVQQGLPVSLAPLFHSGKAGGWRRPPARPPRKERRGEPRPARDPTRSLPFATIIAQLTRPAQRRLPLSDFPLAPGADELPWRLDVRPANRCRSGVSRTYHRLWLWVSAKRNRSCSPVRSGRVRGPSQAREQLPAHTGPRGTKATSRVAFGGGPWYNEGVGNKRTGER